MSSNTHAGQNAGPRWELIYYVFAACVFVTIASSLYLSHRIVDVYIRSVATNKAWAGELKNLEMLGDLAQNVSAPANNVFDSKKPNMERDKRNTALIELDIFLDSLENKFIQIGDRKKRQQLLAKLIAINEAVNRMVREADQILAYFELGLEDKAARHAAAMNRRYAAVTTVISQAVQVVQDYQASNFQARVGLAKNLRSYEAIIGSTVVLLVLCLVVYGQKLARAMRSYQRDLKEARDKSDTANKAKSAFLAAMSHEIRTPMNGVLGMAGVLLGTKLDSQQRQSVEIIKESGNVLLDLLNDILDLSKIEAGHFELDITESSVSHLLASTGALWESRAQAKGLVFKIENQITENNGIKTDVNRVRQILYNLISNAIKFTANGHIHVVASEATRDDGKVELRFEVRDTGIGLTEQEIEKLFTPFTQADASTTRKFGGTGLGLSISKNLANLLGGEIGVKSVTGVGSSFWFTILVEPADGPTFKEPEMEVNPEEFQIPEIAPGLTILVAEDNHVNQKVIVKILSALTDQVDLAGNGLEVLSAIRTKRYDVILMDSQMPEMDGITAARKIRELPNEKIARTPIIALTANAMQGDRERYLDAGMNEYVTKPIDPQRLFGAIIRCVDASDGRDSINEQLTSRDLTANPRS